MTPRTTPTELNDNEYGLAYGLGRFAWNLGYLRGLSLLAGHRVLGLIVLGSTALFAGTYTDSQGLVYSTNESAFTAMVTVGANGIITIPSTINDGTNTYSVTAIKASAFAYRGVSSVIIPDSVTSMGANAFDSCTGLNTVVIGRGITSIPDRAFNQCFSITSLTLPDTLITIGEGAFYNLAYHRNNLIIPASVTTIASNAFGQCGSNAIIFQGNAPSAASDWYNRFGSGTGTGYYQTGKTGWSSTLGTLSMSLLAAPTVTSVSPSFGSASGGSSITITGTGLGPVTGVTIGGVAATSVVATSATTITATTPAGSAGAKSVLVTTAGGTNAANTLYTYLGTYTDSQGVVYATNSGALTASVTTGANGNITIPATIYDGTNTYAVTAINASAFTGRGVSSVTIADSVTSLGADAFNSCTGLSTVVIGRGITSIPDRAFNQCFSITSLTLPDTLISIGAEAFNNLAYHSSNLIIPASVTTIASNAFGQCGSNAIIFQGNAPSAASDWYNRFGSGTGTGYYQTGTTGWSSTLGTLSMSLLAAPTVTGVSPSSGTASGGTSIIITGTGLGPVTGVTIGGVAATSVVATSATTITATTPAGSAGAKSVLVTTVGGTNTANTLYTYLGTYTDTQGLVYETNSVALTASVRTGASGNITIPSTINDGTNTYSVTAIKASAFYGQQLSSVTIPDSVTSMGANAFNMCIYLNTVVIGRGITSIPERAFSDCYNITTLTLPDTLTTIGSYAFYNLDYMRNLVIPASVTSIADNAFMECGVNVIIFRGNAPSVGSNWYARKGSRPGTAEGYYRTGTTGWSSTLGALSMTLLAPPTVTSPTSASVASTSATLGGNVTATGGASLTAVGVVYAITSTNSNPRLSGTGVTNVAGTAATGVFTVNATSLTAGTTYSYAAYATTSEGTTYSSSGTFTTVSAPVNTVPGALSVVEETALAFTGANLITVADPDGTVLTTKLSVAHGTLTVSLSGGATLGAGANGSATLTLVGTSAQVNAALATLTYLPGLNYSGSDTLTLVTTKNLSGFGVGAQYGPVAGFSYVANPILGDGRTPDKAFDGTTTDSHSAGFSASASNPFYFKITAPDLKVISSYYMSGRDGNDHKPSSWTFQGSNDDNTWTVLDTQSGINLTFGTITTGAMSSFVFSNSSPFRYYRFAITASTGPYIVIGEMALVGQTVLADSDTVALTVTNVNDAPTLAAIALTGTEDTTFTFTAADFTAAYTDPESPAPASITIATLPATGTLKLSGTNVTANQVIPAANLGNLTYVPAANENGAKTFTVTASDGVLSSAAATVTVTLAAVTDAPVNTVPGALSVAEGTALAFTGANLITVADPDGTVTTTKLSVAQGTLTVSLSGGATLGAGANGSATLTLVGTSAQVNAALATLSYQPGLNYSGSDTLTLVTTNNLSGPAFGVGAQYGPVAGFSYEANPILGDSRTPDKAFDGTTTDSHSNGFSASASNPFYFKITAPDLKVISSYYMSGRNGNDNKPSSWTFQGSNDDNTWTVLDTQSDINLTSGTITTGAMSSFVLSNSSPFKYYRFAITASTGGYIILGEMALVGQTVFADSDTVALTVTAVNRAPVISSIANQTTLRGTATAALAFTVGDVETALGSLGVSATSSNPAFVPNANIVFGGSGAARTVTVTPVPGQSGSATITLTVTDEGALTATSAFTLTVLNTAPVVANAIPDQTGIYGNAFSYAFPANTFTDSDVGDTLTTTVSTLPAGITFDATTRTFSGTPRAPSTTTVTVTATDNFGLSVSDAFVLTIEKAALSVTADAKTKVYGAANPALTATITGFVNGETLGTSGVTGAASVTTTATALTGVGSATLTVAVGNLVSANYTFTTFTAGVLSITKAPLIVTADAKTKLYGAANPALTATITGFVNGETSTVVSGTAAVTTTATANSNAGSYAITPAIGTLTAANYAFTTFTNGTLTVGQTSQTLTFGALASKTFGDAAFSVSATSTSGLTPSYSIVSGPATISGSTVTITGAGTVVVRASQAGDGNYTAATPVDQSFTVAKQAPTLTWATPSTITYGTALSATQLNATSSLAAGTITYSPASGTTPSAGTQTLTATFTPTDTANYNTATRTVSLVVGKATPTLTWATPSAITYGTALSATQLNATSSLAAGTITYSPASGTTPSAGTQTLTATFTPTDTANYNTATGTVSLVVNKATPTLTWATPSTITYGTALSATQLNATASVAGSFAYSPASGAILSVGTQTLSATFTPTDTTNYNSASASVSLNVIVAVPGAPTAITATTANGEATVTFTAPSYTGSSAITGYTIRATATDGTIVTVNASGSPAKVTGLTPGKSYRFTITANNSAGSSDTSTTTAALTISLVNQTITFASLTDRTSNSGSFALNASASSGLPVIFTVVSGPALLSGNIVDLTGATGTVKIRASQAGNASYAAAPDVEVSFVVTAGATQAIFSKVESASSKTSEADLAVVLTVNSRDGTLLMVSPSNPSLNGAADFTVGSGGAFSASIASTTGTNYVDPLGGKVLGAPVTYKITGTLVDNVLTGTISPLGYSFKSNVTPPSAGSVAPVGFYKSTALAEGAGVTYSLVGPNNEVLVLAVSATGTVGGLTTLKSDGTYSIATTTSAGNVTLSGGVNPTTTAATATLTLPGNIKVDFSGLSTTTKRTDRLINLSSRAKVGTGESVLITGFVVGGPEPKRVLVRAVGPALGAFGLASTLPNPAIKIYQGSSLIAQNDDWSKEDAADIARLGAFAFTVGSKDAALLTTLAPGAYTAQIADPSGTGTGVALAEIYDASINPNADYQRLVNISSRGRVTPDDGVLIGGFVVTGNSPKTLLVRGIGPALSSFGLAGALADPALTIYQDGKALATNEGWANSAAITTAAIQTGAFTLPSGSKDAAVLITLNPGAYTAQIKSAKNASSGVALIEIYEVP